MTLIPFPVYAPDLSDLNGSTTATLVNVVPRADGYGPVASVSPYSQALADQCRGFFYGRKSDGSITVFAATSTRIYKMSNTDFSWSDVSKGGLAYTALSPGTQWQFAQFGNFVIAVQQNVAPQAFDLVSGTNFADLGGTPPQAGGVAVVGRFLVLYALLSNPNRVHWSKLNDITTWGATGADFQDFPDGGIVRCVAGGEYGVIGQDASIRRMIYAPGSTYTFQIERISEEKGIFAPYSIVRGGDRIFYLAADGAKLLLPGGYPQEIGRETFDRTFFADVDRDNLLYCIGTSDPATTRVFWSYKSLSGPAGGFDKILGYDWTLQRPFLIEQTGEYLASLAKPGISLEGLDSISASIDALSFSLDSFASSSFAQLSIFDTSHKLGLFTGSNKEATLLSAEQDLDGQRIIVRGFIPITDAAGCFGSLSYRETQQASASFTSETAVNSRGLVPLKKDTRYARGKLRIPAGTAWTFARGVQPDFTPGGWR